MKKFGIISLSIIVLLSVLSSVYWIYMEEWGNFHIVTNGVLYRSAQLDTDELFKYVKKYQIKSILNLRGKRKQAHSKWYDEEIKHSKELGITHYDYRISAVKILPTKKIKEILGIMNNLPKPILIHCQGGADRSSLISAAWKYAIEEKSAEESYEQFDVIYFHLPYLGNKTKAMDESFWNFVNDLKNNSER